MIGPVILEMIRLNDHDIRRINHALKVYGVAKCIAENENLKQDTRLIIEAAAVLHDIAIRHCEETYGSAAGHLQEKEGPAIAAPILKKHGVDPAVIERVLFIIAHHHAYTAISDIDHQVIIEADLIVNAEEGDFTLAAFQTAYQKYFKTKTAKEIAARMLLSAGI